jgi:hypothetical protein
VRVLSAVKKIEWGNHKNKILNGFKQKRKKVASKKDA